MGRGYGNWLFDRGLKRLSLSRAKFISRSLGSLVATLPELRAGATLHSTVLLVATTLAVRLCVKHHGLI